MEIILTKTNSSSSTTTVILFVVRTDRHKRSLNSSPASGLKTVYFSLHTCNSSTEDVNANLREARGKHCDPCLKCLKIHFLDCDLIKPPWQLLFLKRILSINTYKSMPLFQVSSRFCTVTTFHNLKKNYLYHSLFTKSLG